MSNRLWLLFCQIVTVAVAILFVVQTLRPHWLPGGNHEAVSPTTVPVLVQGSAPVAATSYAPVAQKVVGAVVNVFTSRRQSSPLGDDSLFRFFFGDQLPAPEQRSTSLGSGVIINSEGYVVTNNHVISGADEIQIALHDGRRFKAKVIGVDVDSDIAVLRTMGTTGPLPILPIAPTNSLRVGDVVLAVGNPFGVGQTVTIGIVSALGRNHLGLSAFEDFIQTDAAINPGNSGGALVDTAGNLVGINTAIFSNSGGSNGIGFAINAGLVSSIVSQIIKNGKVVRGWIGVQVQDLAIDESKGESEQRAQVVGVYRGSPADQAGLMPGDVFASINGEKIQDASQMIRIISSITPGEKAKISVKRQEEIAEFTATIGVRPLIKKER